MNSQKIPTFAFILGGIAILINLCVFTVDERKSAIVLQFGQPKQVYQDAGLKFKLPWPIQEVTFFDGRILEVDPAPERVNISSDSNSPLLKNGDVDPKIIEQVSGEPIIVDTFARYRISDPLLFLQRLRTERMARRQIENVMDSATRDTLGNATLREILSPARARLMNTIRDRVNAEMKPRGVEIVDIRIVRADLTERLQSSTVNRMITERKEAATQTRAKGQEKALEIRSTAEKKRQILIAQAQKSSQITKGEGDEEATRIYAKAYNKDAEFYAFVRSMEAYKNTLSDKDTKFVLSPDNAFLRYLGKKK
ncbi:MAG: protease modulator HflC [Alphaproteobacteria bacterium]|nr:MAG: protease modulator HflC [Alphaproteobacteria bacterium]